MEESKQNEPNENKKLKLFDIEKIKQWYHSNYKKLLFIPYLLLIIALLQIGIQTYKTGEFIKKDVSLKGGVTLTILTENDYDSEFIKKAILLEFPKNDISVNFLRTAGKTSGIIITADIENEKTIIDKFLETIEKHLNINLTPDNHTIEVMGSSLGASFFKETFRALYLAFLFMGMVVFLFFGKEIKYKLLSAGLTTLATIIILSWNSRIAEIIGYLIGIVLLALYIMSSIPSIAVIFAAFSDIIVTMAIINLLDIKIGTAGIAAYLMLIGYSVDTDILLSSRVLKRKEGSYVDRIFSAIKTGMMMTITTFVAVIIGLIFTKSVIISQIMTIVLIGLIVDIINTWIQNAGILLWYLEKKDKAKNEQ